MSPGQTGGDQERSPHGPSMSSNNSLPRGSPAHRWNKNSQHENHVDANFIDQEDYFNHRRPLSSVIELSDERVDLVSALDLEHYGNVSSTPFRWGTPDVESGAASMHVNDDTSSIQRMQEPIKIVSQLHKQPTNQTSSSPKASQATSHTNSSHSQQKAVRAALTPNDASDRNDKDNRGETYKPHYSESTIAVLQKQRTKAEIVEPGWGSRNSSRPGTPKESREEFTGPQSLPSLRSQSFRRLDRKGSKASIKRRPTRRSSLFLIEPEIATNQFFRNVQANEIESQKESQSKYEREGAGTRETIEPSDRDREAKAIHEATLNDDENSSLEKRCIILEARIKELETENEEHKRALASAKQTLETFQNHKIAKYRANGLREIEDTWGGALIRPYDQYEDVFTEIGTNSGYMREGNEQLGFHVSDYKETPEQFEEISKNARRSKMLDKLTEDILVNKETMEGSSTTLENLVDLLKITALAPGQWIELRISLGQLLLEIMESLKERERQLNFERSGVARHEKLEGTERTTVYIEKTNWYEDKGKWEKLHSDKVKELEKTTAKYQKLRELTVGWQEYQREKESLQFQLDEKCIELTTAQNERDQYQKMASYWTSEFEGLRDRFHEREEEYEKWKTDFEQEMMSYVQRYREKSCNNHPDRCAIENQQNRIEELEEALEQRHFDNSRLRRERNVAIEEFRKLNKAVNESKHIAYAPPGYVPGQKNRRTPRYESATEIEERRIQVLELAEWQKNLRKTFNEKEELVQKGRRREMDRRFTREISRQFLKSLHEVR